MSNPNRTTTSLSQKKSITSVGKFNIACGCVTISAISTLGTLLFNAPKPIIAILALATMISSFAMVHFKNLATNIQISGSKTPD